MYLSLWLVQAALGLLVVRKPLDQTSDPLSQPMVVGRSHKTLLTRMDRPGPRPRRRQIEGRDQLPIMLPYYVKCAPVIKVKGDVLID